MKEGSDGGNIMENANDFIYSLHDETPSCGIQLNEFKKIEENYYYIKFDILGDC